MAMSSSRTTILESSGPNPSISKPTALRRITERRECKHGRWDRSTSLTIGSRVPSPARSTVETHAACSRWGCSGVDDDIPTGTVAQVDSRRSGDDRCGRRQKCCHRNETTNRSLEFITRTRKRVCRGWTRDRSQCSKAANQARGWRAGGGSPCRSSTNSHKIDSACLSRHCKRPAAGQKWKGVRRRPGDAIVVTCENATDQAVPDVTPELGMTDLDYRGVDTFATGSDMCWSRLRHPAATSFKRGAQVHGRNHAGARGHVMTDLPTLVRECQHCAESNGVCNGEVVEITTTQVREASSALPRRSAYPDHPRNKQKSFTDACLTCWAPTTRSCLTSCLNECSFEISAATVRSCPHSPGCLCPGRRNGRRVAGLELYRTTSVPTFASIRDGSGSRSCPTEMRQLQCNRCPSRSRARRSN